MKKFFSDFKKFATKGNVMDLAIAVVMGGAFGKIVTSLVNDLIMPLITLIVGGASVGDLKWVITPAVYENGILKTAENALRYGMFLQTIIDFLIISFFIFLALRILMTAKENLSRLEADLVKMNDDDRREMKRTLKAEGKSPKEIKLALKAHEEQLLQAAKIAEEQKKAEAAAAAPETPEKILADIRDLLKKDELKKLD